LPKLETNRILEKDMMKKKIKPKKRARLDASQNALRVVEQAIGGKLVESKPRKSNI
jgi:hypothetical protein